MHVLDLHHRLLTDQVGQEGYRQALREVLRGGEVALDLGTGSGIHALFACEAGAARVYAVDRHGVVELARQVGRANGYADRIRYIHAPIDQVELPERVDVIVAHHALPELLTLLPDARVRFLKPGGVLVPSAVELRCAPVESARLYDEKIEFWATRRFGLDFAPVRTLAVNTIHDCRIEPETLLAAPVRLACFSAYEVPDPTLRAVVEVEVTRAGTLHGLGLWYDQWLTRNVVLSTGPGSKLPSPLWLNAFLPIAAPVPVELGECVTMKIQAGPGDWGKLWTWIVTVRNRPGQEKARFSQSTFSSWSLPDDVLRKQAPGYVPRLTPLGVAARLVLELGEKGKVLREIEDEIFERYPLLFRSRGAAAGFVAEIVAQYCL